MSPDERPAKTADQELAELRQQLRQQDALLRSALIEKGEALLGQLLASRERAHKEASSATLEPVGHVLLHASFRTRLVFEIDRARAAGEPLSLLLCDLDRFSALTARVGYIEGDRVLARVGSSLPSLWLAEPAQRP